MTKDLPKLISYSSITQFDGKMITVNEKENLNEFLVKRIYWINYFTEKDTYSEHAHKSLKQILIAVHGEVIINLESPDKTIYSFTLNDPSQGLYIPSMHWKRIDYKNPSILLCLASEPYDENDYIRSYEDFKKFQK